jgi:hypothetical protein
MESQVHLIVYQLLFLDQYIHFLKIALHALLKLEKKQNTTKETNITTYGYKYVSIFVEKNCTYDHTYNHRNKMQLPRLQISLQVDDLLVPCVY